jgi:hypothetical protein
MRSTLHATEQETYSFDHNIRYVATDLPDRRVAFVYSPTTQYGQPGAVQTKYLVALCLIPDEITDPWKIVVAEQHFYAPEPVMR